MTELIGRLRTEGGYTILVIEHDMHVVEGIWTVSSRSTTASRSPRARSSVATTERGGGVLGRARRQEEAGRCCSASSDVDTYYGEIHILQGDRSRWEGELVCLLGGNASGKSTTLKTILGIVRPRAGPVEFGGEDVTDGATSYRIGRGMAIVPENRRLFAPMTVLENLEMGAYLRKGDLAEELERVYGLFPLLHERRKQLAGTLSGGEQQMVAMGRALMSRPKLLLMDEPSMGLAPILVERNFEIIQQVHEAGVAVLVVEQNANMSLSIADRGYVLQTGRIVLADAARGAAWPNEDSARPTLAAERHPRAASADRIRHASRSSSGSSTSTAARRARSRTPCARRTRTTSRDWDEQGAPWEYWVERTEAARTAFAGLINAEPDEIAVTTSVSAGVSALASGLRFARRSKIVVTDLEFPTIGQIWHAQEARGARVVHVRREPESIPLELRGAIDDDTLLVSHRRTSRTGPARWWTSPAVVAARARARRARPARRLPDRRLAAGGRQGARRRLPRRRRPQVPARLGRARLLLLPEGARGARPGRRRPAGSPTEDIFEMDIHDYSPSPTARRFQSGTPPVPSIYAGIAGIELMQEIGIAETREHVLRPERPADRRRRRARRDGRDAEGARATRAR